MPKTFIRHWMKLPGVTGPSRGRSRTHDTCARDRPHDDPMTELWPSCDLMKVVDLGQTVWLVVSLWRFVVSSCCYRPLREAIIRRTVHETSTWFHALIHDVFIPNLLWADQVRCRLKSGILWRATYGIENETGCLLHTLTQFCIFRVHLRSRPKCSYIQIFQF